jgi:hypothetical protein
MSSRKKKKRRSGHKPVPAPPKKHFPALWVSLIIVVAVAAVFLVASNLRRDELNPPSESASGNLKGQKTASPRPSDGFGPLLGRWRRPDGGYIIEIRDITNDGRMDAVYLNPRPINISQAAVIWQEDVRQVFIELQDKGYPGSTYTLDYDPEQDLLTGIYFQAAMNQAFEVVFIRAK